ncbi:MAG: hypothetical protein SOX13_06450 [Sodaliphilus sp.]|nr:hypothetical protein [Sodaliphilus sp.]
MDLSFSNLNFNSVENLPGFEARAAFTVNFASVFREDVDIVPTIVDDSLSYVPWGGDNNMPFDILKLIEEGEQTGIEDVAASKQVASVEYYSVSGIKNAEPVDGVNIKVVRYTDGSLQTSKFVK